MVGTSILLYHAALICITLLLYISVGLVGNEMLRHLASEIGDEWKRLAQCLNIRRMRIQAIVRNNVNSDSEQVIYDMLLTWAKKVPRSVNKVGGPLHAHVKIITLPPIALLQVEILCHALLQCGRSDLAEELKNRDLDFRQERAAALRGGFFEHISPKFMQWQVLWCHCAM
jgi:hypothetical protein